MPVSPAIPARGGLGLKPEHVRDILETGPALGFFEIHAENYMGAGGPPHRALTAIRERYPVSLHGVGLSIGGMAALDQAHLGRLAELNRRYQPGLVSEHLAWSSHETGYLADLLPLPYTLETLTRTAAHIGEVQDALGRQMLLENPASYLSFAESSFAEADFIAELVRRTGCGLLLDVNNVFISAANLGFAPQAYLDAYPMRAVQEIHLAGHDAQRDETGAPVLIDDHGSAIADPVWALYAGVIARTGPLPSLIERDANVPPLSGLLEEAARADAILASARRRAA